MSIEFPNNENPWTRYPGVPEGNPSYRRRYSLADLRLLSRYTDFSTTSFENGSVRFDFRDEDGVLEGISVRVESNLLQRHSEMEIQDFVVREVIRRESAERERINRARMQGLMDRTLRTTIPNHLGAYANWIQERRPQPEVSEPIPFTMADSRSNSSAEQVEDRKKVITYPFDFERAKNGDTVVTRDGVRVDQIYFFEVPEDSPAHRKHRPIIALVDKEPRWFSKAGKAEMSGTVKTDLRMKYETSEEEFN